MLKIIVPLTPPSQNHYMKYRVATMHGRPTVVSYPAKDAKAWWKAIGACVAGRRISAQWYEVAYVVYQGPSERGDVDNYGKCVLDGLVKAGAIDSDHKVLAMHAYKTRDRGNPRTEIFVRPYGQLVLLDLPMPPLEVVEEW